MVTAELAVAMPALVLVVSLLIAVVETAFDVSRVSDAARSAARSLSIGTEQQTVEHQLREAVPEGDFTVEYGGGEVLVRVSSPAHSWGPLDLPQPAASSVALLEPGVAP